MCSGQKSEKMHNLWKLYCLPQRMFFKKEFPRKLASLHVNTIFIILFFQFLGHHSQTSGVVVHKKFCRHEAPKSSQ